MSWLAWHQSRLMPSAVLCSPNLGCGPPRSESQSEGQVTGGRSAVKTVQTLIVMMILTNSSSCFSDLSRFSTKTDNCCDVSIPELQRHLSYPDIFNKRLEIEISVIFHIQRHLCLLNQKPFETTATMVAKSGLESQK